MAKALQPRWPQDRVGDAKLQEAPSPAWSCSGVRNPEPRFPSAHAEWLRHGQGGAGRPLTESPTVPGVALTIANSGRAAGPGGQRGKGRLKLWPWSLYRIPPEMPLSTSSGRPGRTG